jgi:hypothetical protein
MQGCFRLLITLQIVLFASIALLTSNFAIAMVASSDTAPISQNAKNILELNTTAFDNYRPARAKFETELLKTTPIIVSNELGPMTLYRPGKAPLMAPPPPLEFQLTHSIAHTILTVYLISSPYLNTSQINKTWVPKFQQFQKQIKDAMSSVDNLKLKDDDRLAYLSLLTKVNSYLSLCLKRQYIAMTDFNSFMLQSRVDLAKLIKIGDTYLLVPYMQIVSQWKKILGSDWDKTYAIVTAGYQFRQNSMMFSILAEFMGKNAINHRLFLFGTTSDDSPKYSELIDNLSRILIDRQIGQAALGDYYLMDSGLIYDAGMKVISENLKQYNLPNILPDFEPFNSTDWPWRHNPNSGSGPATIDDIIKSR